MKKILIIGANSFVGKNIVKTLKGLKKYDLIGAFYNKKNKDLKNQVRLDITKKEDVLKILKKENSDIIIILSAISSSREKKEKIKSINIDAVSNIMFSLKKLDLNSKIIFFSTDQVFNGKKGKYSENDTPHPINEYGKSKLKAENIVKKNKNHIILRCSLILGNKSEDDHENFVTNFINSKEKMRIFSDVCRTPVYVKDIGKIIKKLIETDYNGVINLGGPDYLSFLDMTKKIEKEYCIKKEYDVVLCKEKTIPKKLGLNNDLLSGLIDFKLTDFQNMLKDMKIDMKKQKGEA